MKKLKLLLKIIIFIFLITLLINIYVYLYSKNNIIEISSLKEEYNIDCIVILGASVRNNQPSKMLKDRLNKGLEIYEKNITNKILITGDHQDKTYNEVGVMNEYLQENNILPENIFLDHYGISTYDSLYRAKYNYQANHIIIVTQKYHMYRSIYIAKHLDMQVYGIIAEGDSYSGQTKRTIREYFANIKDFIKCLIKPTSTYLGKSYNIKGNGEITQEK